MFADADLDEQITIGPAVLAGCALALHPEGLAVADARGDLDREAGFVAYVAVAAAGRTVLGVECAVAATAPTGLGLLDAAERGLLDLCRLAAAVTLRAGFGVGAFGMARSLTVRAGLGAGDGELLFCARGGLLQFDREVGSEIGALAWAALATAAATATAVEELLEDVAEPATAHPAATHAAERVAAGTAHAAHPAAPPRTAAVEPAAFFGLLEALVTHLVVGLAFLVVGEHLLCLLRLFELLVGVRVVGDVGVVLGGLLAIGLFDFVLAGVARDAEYRVEVLTHCPVYWLRTLQQNGFDTRARSRREIVIPPRSPRLGE
ncbi:putative glutamate dehydrogenase [Halococcus morrhuae DSM 1307]|uniref:Putative glutamate dehydrogenase n=1 Tax=Halococcus morrhuae DSM 1307 TaxID=931277 RepID=M0MPU9_HALMO|nr:putative glutamate dehydrogenase [Halococcus morrhuae DSM 1307]